jgi:hypothetical protein
MKAIRMKRNIETDGEIHLTDLPVKRGETVEISITSLATSNALTASRLLESDAISMWKDFADTADSSSFARRLRDAAQNRR